MTIDKLIQRVESGEIVVLDDPDDIMDSVRWAKNTDKAMRGWTMEINSHKTPPNVTFYIKARVRCKPCKLSLFDQDICRHNHGGNTESVVAHARTNKDRDCGRVLDRIRECGQDGATCDELEFGLTMSHQTCSARCSDLLRLGLVMRKPFRDTYERRKTRAGRPAAVLVLREGRR